MLIRAMLLKNLFMHFYKRQWCHQLVLVTHLIRIWWYLQASFFDGSNLLFLSSPPFLSLILYLRLFLSLFYFYIHLSFHHPSPSSPVCGVGPSALHQLWSLFFFGFLFRNSTFKGISATPSTSLNSQSVLPLFSGWFSPPQIWKSCFFCLDRAGKVRGLERFWEFPGTWKSSCFTSQQVKLTS